MFDLVEYRNMLMRELDYGYFDRPAWEACAKWAEMIGCVNIQSRVERYIKHYSGG